MIGKYQAVTYSRHARNQMRERKIGANQVERTIASPDTLTSSRGKMVAEKATAMGNIIRVVYAEEASGTVALVVTVIRIGR